MICPRVQVLALDTNTLTFGPYMDLRVSLQYNRLSLGRSTYVQL